MCCVESGGFGKPPELRAHDRTIIADLVIQDGLRNVGT